MIDPKKEISGKSDQLKPLDDSESSLTSTERGPKNLEGGEKKITHRVLLLLETLIKKSAYMKKQLAEYHTTMRSLLERNLKGSDKTSSAIKELTEMLVSIRENLIATKGSSSELNMVDEGSSSPVSPVNAFLDGSAVPGPLEKRDLLGKSPILTRLPDDYLSNVVVMRWVEFLFNRVVRDRLPLVLDYYKDVGWISEEVKSTIMAVARGENQDFQMPEIEGKEEIDLSQIPTGKREYKRMDDWRLTAEDHLRSLLFIHMIAGVRVDKDRLSSLEQTINNIRRGLKRFHGV